jgi:hypothetical protein
LSGKGFLVEVQADTIVEIYYIQSTGGIMRWQLWKICETDLLHSTKFGAHSIPWDSAFM